MGSFEAEVAEAFEGQVALTFLELRSRLPEISENNLASTMRSMLAAGKMESTYTGRHILYRLAKAEVVAVGWRPEVVSDPEPAEKMYLVCDDCGEAFDTIETAVAHHDSPDCPVQQNHEYTIKPESEAF